MGIKQLTDNPNKSDELFKKTVTGIIEKIEKDKIFVNFDDNKNGFIKRTNLANLLWRRPINALSVVRFSFRRRRLVFVPATMPIRPLFNRSLPLLVGYPAALVA